MKRISSDKVLLISPAPVDEERQHNRTNKVLGQYADVVESGERNRKLFSKFVRRNDSGTEL